MKKEKETVHIAFSKDDFEFLKKIADERELKVSTFIRSYLLTTLKSRPQVEYSVTKKV